MHKLLSSLLLRLQTAHVPMLPFPISQLVSDRHIMESGTSCLQLDVLGGSLPYEVLPPLSPPQVGAALKGFREGVRPTAKGPEGLAACRRLSPPAAAHVDRWGRTQSQRVRVQH